MKKSQTSKKIPVTVNLDRPVHDEVVKLQKSKGSRVSLSLVCADAIAYSVMPEYQEQRDEAILKRLDRLEASYRRHRELTVRDMAIIREMLGTFIKVWFANTPEIPEEHKKASARSGEARFEKFMDLLERNLTGDSSTTMGLVELADIDEEELEELAEKNERED